MDRSGSPVGEATSTRIGAATSGNTNPPHEGMPYLPCRLCTGAVVAANLLGPMPQGPHFCDGTTSMGCAADAGAAGGRRCAVSRHRLRYDFEAGDFGPDDTDRGRKGLCDAILLVSVVREFPEEPFRGRKSFGCISVDGANRTPGDERACEAMPPAEIFQAFAMLATNLAENPDLEHWQRTVAKDAIEAVRAKMRAKGEKQRRKGGACA